MILSLINNDKEDYLRKHLNEFPKMHEKMQWEYCALKSIQEFVQQGFLMIG